MTKILFGLAIFSVVLIGCTSSSNNLKADKPTKELVVSSSCYEIPGGSEWPKDSLNVDVLLEKWRMVSFLNKNYFSIVQKDFDSIAKVLHSNQIIQHEYVKAYENSYMRTYIPKPLDLELTKSELTNSFSDVELGSVSYTRYGRIRDGFSMNISDAMFYALEMDSNIIVLGFSNLNEETDVSQLSEELERFMKKYDIMLVDWNTCEIIYSQEIASYINRKVD